MSTPPTAAVDAFRAYFYHKFGDCKDVLLLADAAAPPPLLDTHVRVKIVSSATNPADVVFVEMAAFASSLLPQPPTANNPLRLGCDLSGIVVQVGADVTRFQVGDAVYGTATFDGVGSFAEYLDIDAHLIAKKPDALSFNHAAGLALAGETSYEALVECIKLQPKERVLILGASGGTGVFAVQIAKALGAFVIATTSFRNVDFVRSLGADEVIDYTKEDWGTALELHSIDGIYDCGVEPNAWNDRAQTVLKRSTGRFVTIGLMNDPIESPIGASWQRLFGRSDEAILAKLNELVEAGKLVVPVDSVYPFEKLPEALERQKSRRARGKIIVEIGVEAAKADKQP